ncbi:hypothetical protein TNCV_3462601 [Trichonephila clavipes]|nr:hypothetical protein TNCV_3462601 [Trichonephila clavipes]
MTPSSPASLINHQSDSSTSPNGCVIPCSSSIIPDSCILQPIRNHLFKPATTARRLRHPLPAHRLHPQMNSSVYQSGGFFSSQTSTSRTLIQFYVMGRKIPKTFSVYCLSDLNLLQRKH